MQQCLSKFLIIAGFLAAKTSMAAEPTDDYVTVNLSFPATQVQLYSLDQSNMISYAPDSPRYLGVGMSYNEYNISLGYNFGFLNGGSTSASQYDVRFGHDWSSVAVDAGYSRYAGFNIVNSEGFDDNELSQHSYVPRDNLRLQAATVDLYYLAWTDGTFELNDILGTTPSHGNGDGLIGILSGDQTVITDSDGLVPETARSKIAGSSNIHSITGYLFSAQLGLGGSRTYWERWFASWSMAYGLGFGKVAYSADGENHAGSGMATKLNTKASVGYMGEEMFGGLLLAIEEPKYKLSSLYFQTSRQIATLYVGSRF